MIVVFGSDGFLGDRMVAKLQGVRDANLSYNEVDTSVCGSPVITFTDKDDFFHFLLEHYREVTWVIYCDKRIPNTVLSVFRYEFVQKLWTLSASYSIPLLYVFHQPAESPLSDFKADIFEQWTGNNIGDLPSGTFSGWGRSMVRMRNDLGNSLPGFTCFTGRFWRQERQCSQCTTMILTAKVHCGIICMCRMHCGCSIGSCCIVPQMGFMI